ncbi:flagellar hook-basal body protein [Trinickia diaoshuihuensis]|uniref:flagellar hook-basal body protein n=1 Tax=Trinickia diaoshuihuensis TaxID=2292265 RepID=UPI000E288A9C|nr:flagellar hook-basal body protein [Trinickia diaoshuihuensis]
MDDIFAIASIGMQQDLAKVDRVATNMANVSTPAYRREVLGAAPFVELARLSARSGQAGASSPAEASFDQASMRVLLDTRPGTLKVTGEPLDVALTSEGFFEIQTANGTAYTRQGNFTVDSRGRLVTAQGDPVMGRGGEIYLNTTTPVIDAQGNITEPAAPGQSSGAQHAPVAQLKVVTFDDEQSLARIGDGLYAAGSGLKVVADAAAIHQGALENSNVNAMREMMQLMQSTRHFESMQKVVQNYDGLLETAIHKLGDLS